jgi:hypothetical protein
MLLPLMDVHLHCKRMTSCLIESTLIYTLELQIIASRSLLKSEVLSLFVVKSQRFQCVNFCIVFTRNFCLAFMR